MGAMFSGRSIGISELWDAPVRAFEQAGNGAVLMLSHNRPAGYIVSNALMPRVMDALANRAVAQKAGERVASRSKAHKISLDEL